MDTSIGCAICRASNPISAAMCQACNEPLDSDTAKLRILLRRVSHYMAKSASAPASPTGDDGDKVRAAQSRAATLQGELDVQARRVAELQAQLSAAHATFAQTLRDKDEEIKHLRVRLAELESHQHLNASLATVKVIAPTAFADAQPLVTTPNFQLDVGTVNGRLVVRKQFSSSDTEETLVNKFKESIAMMAKLEGGAGSVVKLMGATGMNHRNPVVYLEYLEHGDLRAMLARTLKTPLPWTARIQIALQVAKGLAKMHAMDLIHRDVNTSHILLDGNNVAKLTGLSNAREKSLNSMTNGVGDFRYAAPETMKDGQWYSEKADIYSLGLVMVELDTHVVPYGHMRDPRKPDRPMGEFMLAEKLRKAKEGDAVTHHAFVDSPEWYQDLARACTSLEPDKRPSAVEVARRLQEQLRTSPSLVVPLAPAVVNMRLTVVEANSILATQAFGTQSPICKVGLGGTEFATQPHSRGGRDPRWNERFDFLTVNVMEMVLEANILNIQWWLEGQIGKCNLPLYEAMDGMATSLSRRMWLPVYSRGDNHGYLTIDIEFYGDIPRWLQEYIASMNSYIGTLDHDKTATIDEARGKIAIAARLLDQFVTPP